MVGVNMEALIHVKREHRAGNESLSYQERLEFERTFWIGSTILCEPPFWNKQLRIISPEKIHPSGGVRCYIDSASLLHFESIRKNIVLQGRLPILLSNLRNQAQEMTGCECSLEFMVNVKIMHLFQGHFR
ncbi:hypothetical protein MLD38_030352 [Melastoma candidum]|uniref:Uncharacterized protein n=1 Tax=Melastoma candidum TaxID=119954 RepID=A0ACB9ML57_9MYRT|nr:hypothetical protein MLD38_030352 [Melastoma candidum]